MAYSCAHCGEDVLPPKVYCDKACKQAAKDKRRKASAIGCTCGQCRRCRQRDAAKRWHRRNPERMATYQATHHMRTSLLRDPNTWDMGAYVRAVRLDPCAYCGGIADALDHVEPLLRDAIQRGRDLTVDHWDNLAAVCTSCNSQKGTKPLLLHLAHKNGCWEWRQGSKPPTIRQHEHRERQG